MTAVPRRALTLGIILAAAITLIATQARAQTPTPPVVLASPTPNVFTPLGAPTSSIATTTPTGFTAGTVSAGDFLVVIPPQNYVGIVGQTTGTLTALANGQPCATAQLTGITTEIVLRLGSAGQPAACSTDGARVTFKTAGDQELLVEMALLKSTTARLTNLAPKAPAAGQAQATAQAGSASLAAAPTAVSQALAPLPLTSNVSPSFIAPPSTGDAGLRSSDD